MHRPHFVHPFIHWWTRRLLPPLATNLGVLISQVSAVYSSGVIPCRGMSEMDGIICFIFWKPPYYTPEWLQHLHYHWQSTKIPVFPHPADTLLFSGSLSNRQEVLSLCGFNMHFPNELWCWVAFQVLVGQFSWEISIEVLCSFYHWAVVLLYFNTSFIYNPRDWGHSGSMVS